MNTLLMHEIDYWRAAAQMPPQHRENAALEAVPKTDAHLDRGDIERVGVCKRIVAAINALEQDEPAKGRPLH
jgi:hypothetical protein